MKPAGIKFKVGGKPVDRKQKRQKERKDKGDRPSKRQALGDSPSQQHTARSDGLSQSITNVEEALGKMSVKKNDNIDSVQDFTALDLKEDHVNRPLWVCPDGRIFLETFSPVYKQAYDFLIAIAEPQSRPETVHEYLLTPHSLYAAVSVGLETETIIMVLGRLSKVQLSIEIKRFIRESTENYGKVKLVLQHNRFYVESRNPEVLERLLKDDVIWKAFVPQDGHSKHPHLRKGKANRDKAGAELAKVDAKEMDVDEQNGNTQEAQDEDEDQSADVYSFEIEASQVEYVKQRCLPSGPDNPGGLNYPMLEEYDFRNDKKNPDLNVELKPNVSHRPYQEKSLTKMFGNGRARSGIIVLPCGAGKSLTGISAAVRIRKSCLVVCTSSVSVDQWRHQFRIWTTLEDNQISRFTSDEKETFAGSAGITITTYTMVNFSGRRSEESEKVMDGIKNREWGLLLLDEVHVVPAQMFRKVIGIIKAHCKLGLTATLVREDKRISDLNFLIGPKLYEANWLDLTRDGHIANVQCAEIWCPMTKEFFREYLKKENSSRKQLLYVMNPNKFRVCQFLIDYHERQRGDKVIVFSDNIFALKEYAVELRKPYIYGPTSHAERTRILHAFKHNPTVNTVFLSKVGDNSLDIPEANVLIQISSHAGSRRQEAQRLGRILRAKKSKPGTMGDDEFNAFFYTLVSKDTQEMFFSTKRQQFLIDQGYSFKVITNLLDTQDTHDANLKYASKEDQLNLLTRVLHAGEEEAGEETLEDADDLTRQLQPSAKRVVGDMSALTGAKGRFYLEYSTHAGDKRKQYPRPKKSEKTKKLERMIGIG